MGGSSAPKQKISSEEKDMAVQAASRWNERIDDGYLDLEKQAIADAGLDHTNLIGGRSSADLAISERAGLRGVVGSGGSNRDVAEFGNTIAGASTTQDVDSASQAQSMRDTKRLGVSKLGSDIALTSSGGLRNAAANASSRSMNKVDNQILKSNAKTNAVLSAASGFASGAALRNEGFRMTKQGLAKTNAPGFNNKAPSGADLEKSGNRISYTDMLPGGF
jgi:hypothetical protein